MNYIKIKPFIWNLLSVLLVLALYISCENDSDKDTQKPEILLNQQNAFPKGCDTLYFGESFTFKALLKDNAMLSSYSIEIHHNFDHHSHSTEFTTCEFDPDKEAVNPLKTVLDFSVPEGLMEYETNNTIKLESENSKASFDPGDYHFTINLVDKNGWSTIKGLNVKILHR